MSNVIDKTAMYCAAEEYHRDIVDLLLVSSGAVMDQQIQDGELE